MPDEEELLSENEKLKRRLRENGEERTEEDVSEPQNDRDERHEAWLKQRREWLRSLTQEDRNFIAKYGEEAWKKWKNASWRKNGGTAQP